VYANEAGELDPRGKNRISQRFTIDDARTVILWGAAGTFVYGEMSLLAPPTEPDAITMLSGFFAVQPTGWAGRWFRRLEDVPEAMGRPPWRYEGPGLVLLRNDETLVLEGAQPPLAVGQLPDGGTFEAPLSTWFEVVSTSLEPDASLWLTDVPDEVERLRAAGIPARIPLIVRNERTVYVAADASDEPAEFLLRTVAGGASFMRLIPRMGGTEFYYHVYVPLMGWLVDQAAGRSTRQ
jgi:hypothetical protein